MNTYQKYLYKITILLCGFGVLASYIFIESSNHIPDMPMVRQPFEYLKIKKSLPMLNKHGKVVILSGSNAFFGFKANLFEKYTGLPTVNMAVQGSLGISYMLYYIKPHLQKGDIIILPLEYTVLLSNSVNNFISAQVSYAFGLDYLNSLPIQQKLEYLRVFKKEYFFDAVKRGLKKKLTYVPLPIEHCVNSNGDMICNKSSEQTRIGVKKLIRAQQPQDNFFINPKNKRTLPDYISLDILINFFSWAHDNDITVIGTYPNTVGLIKDRSLIKKIKNWYVEHNQIFIGEISESIFPENMMFDTVYHLNTEGAVLRTKLFSIRFCKETTYCKKTKRIT